MKIRKPRIKKDLKAYGGKIRTIEIEESLSRFFDVRKCIIVPNISWGLELRETDLLVITKSGCAKSIEIKISKSDFNADFKKKHDHTDHKNRIKEFYFAIPIEMYEYCKPLIPEHVGIITCERHKTNSIVVSHIKRQAKTTPKSIKLTELEINKVLRLSVYRIWTLKKKIISLQNEKLLLSLQKEKKPTIKK